MEIPELGEICLNVEASKVSAAFSQVIAVLRHLNEKQEGLANQLAALSDKVAATEDLQKQLTTLEEKNEKSIEELKSFSRELEGLKLEEQSKMMEQHSQQFEKTLSLLEQGDLKWKEQDAKLAQMSIESRQSSTYIQKMATDVCSLRSVVEVYHKALADIKADQAECAERCSQVEEFQHKLQESVSSKYQKLWQEVVGALERVNTTELVNYQAELKRSAQHSEQRVQQLVSYALNLVAQAAKDRRNADLKKAVLLRWKETAWLGARQRMACRLLHGLLRSHCRKHLRTMQQVTAWEFHVSRLKREFQACLPDMDTVFKRLVQPAVATWEESSAANKTLTHQLQEQVEHLAVHTRGLEEATSSLSIRTENTLKSVEQLQEGFEQVLARSNSDKERADEFETQMKEVIEQISQVARHDEMQGIMKDILLIWTAVKQIDATKADKRDLDSLATESSTRGQHQMLQGQLSGAEDNMKDISSRHQTINFIVGVMMRFMEDIVRKILYIDSKGLTGAHTGRGGIVVRTGGGWLPPPPSTSSVYASARAKTSSPCCRAASPILPSGENGSSQSSVGSAMGKIGRQAARGGLEKPSGRCCRTLPTARANLESKEAITAQDMQDNIQGTERLDADNSLGISGSIDCREIHNPAVRTFCEWVEQVRAVFEAPALGACGGHVTTADASAGLGARAPLRERARLEVRGSEAYLPAEISRRPGTAGPGLQATTAKQQWRHKLHGGCDKACNRSSSSGYSPTLKSNRSTRATNSCNAWGIFS